MLSTPASWRVGVDEQRALDSSYSSHSATVQQTTCQAAIRWCPLAGCGRVPAEPVSLRRSTCIVDYSTLPYQFGLLMPNPVIEPNDQARRVFATHGLCRHLLWRVHTHRRRPTSTRRRSLAARAVTVGLTVLAVAATTAALPARDDHSASSTAPTSSGAAPTSGELEQTGPDQQRWSSVPGSRIVLNPYDFNSPLTPVQQSTGPQLPLSAGYYAADEANVARDIVEVYQRPAGDPPPPDIDVGFHDDFVTLDPAWVPEPGVEPTTVDEALHLHLAADAPNAWGALSREVTLDVDTHQQVQITVTSAEAAWALKVNDGTQPVDTTLQGDTHQVGTFTYDLAAATGWTGTKTFQLKLFAVGRGATLVVDDVRIQSEPVPWLQSAESFTTSWLPHSLPFDASYANGSHLTGQDVFYDKQSVIRELTFAGLPADGSAIQIAGAYSGAVSSDSARRTVTISHATYRYAIAVPAAEARIDYYASRNDLIAGGPTVPEPSPTGFWALTITPDAKTFTTQVGVGFAAAAEPVEAAARRAREAARARPGSASARWERFWDNQLATVPHPQDYTIRAVNDKGVTAAQVRAAYYRAWVFLLADVLPPEPEVGYAYPQLATGKPSMWNYGAEGARASASWDALMGMQYLAYVDPTTAWRAFTGLMTLVDDDGMLGGESLPSRKAQTAWILYVLTGDKARLQAIYPALRRHLLWARENPRWIFGDHDDPNERDAEFVVSLLVDFGYAKRIAATLQKPNEVAFWQNQYDTFFDDYLRWFWETPTSEPRQYYFLDTGQESPGNTLWVTTGLHLPTISGDYRAGLLSRFHNTYDPAANLAGFGFPNIKAPDVTYTTYGLLEQGLPEEATGLTEIVLRDMVRAGEYAEVYQPGPEGPEGKGVRPSLFGAVNVIDSVWLRNGYRMDAGDPRFVLLDVSGSEQEGIDGLRLQGRTLHVRADAEREQVVLSGSLIRGRPECRVVSTPIGTTVPLPAGCATVDW